jgi:hypothetical protein
MLNEGNQIHNFISSYGSGTIINYGSGSDFLTSYGYGSGSGSTSQKVTVPTVPVPQRCLCDSWLARLSASLARFSCRCLEQSEGSTSGRKSYMCVRIIRTVTVSGNALNIKICFVNLP